jgi:AcrR family transcriptional regulator
MTGKSRRDLYAEQTRAAVIAAATARFAADGYAATTMDAIAEDAQVAKGGLYHHFASKAELLEAVFIAMEASLLGRVEEAGAKIWDEPGGSHDPLDLLGTGLDVFLAACAEPAYRQIALQDAPAVLGLARYRAIGEEFYLAGLRAGLALLTATGRYAVPPGDLPARMILAALGEAGLAVAEAADPEAERARARAVILQLIGGFRVHVT